MSASYGRIVMIFLPCQSARVLLRCGLLVIGLLLPGVAPAVVESVVSLGSETEVEGEDITECMTQAETHRLRKRRAYQPRTSHRSISASDRTTGSDWMLGRRGMSGHRISNGLLAPIRC